MLTAYKQKLPQEFSPYNPFPNIQKRDEWLKIPSQYRQKLIADGEVYLDFNYPALTAADWLDYTRTGARLYFESKYFLRRRAVCSLILAECCEDKGRFLEDIQNGIFLICEESAWQVPAHNTYIRDTPTLPFPDISRPILDLFACETAELLAMAIYLLGDKISLLQERIRLEMEKRIFTPFESSWFWWMGGPGGYTNNWSVWCTQNILIAAFCLRLNNDELVRITAKSMQILNNFVAGYGEDGCCDEGAAYYRHAGLCLFGALDLIDEVSCGAINNVWQEEKIRNIAHYILDAHVDDKYYINFADCSALAGRAGVREYLFGKRCQDKALCDFAADDWRRDNNPTRAEDINLFFRTQAAFTVEEIMSHKTPQHIEHRDIFYPSTGLFIARDSNYCLAVKAGDNDDSHNHNDTGSIIVYKNGQPMLIDIGVESYTKKTFSPQRYEIWTMQSSWHNLPDFDGVQQCPGPEFKALNTQVHLDDSICRIDMHLQEAWPKESGLQLYKREVCLHKGEYICMKDMCTGSFKSSVLNLMFCERPRIENNSLVLKDGNIIFECASVAVNIEVEDVNITDPRLLLAWPDTLYRARIKFLGELITTIL